MTTEVWSLINTNVQVFIELIRYEIFNRSMKNTAKKNEKKNNNRIMSLHITEFITMPL